jgi:hypothetical protein
MVFWFIGVPAILILEWKVGARGWSSWTSLFLHIEEPGSSGAIGRHTTAVGKKCRSVATRVESGCWVGQVADHVVLGRLTRHTFREGCSAWGGEGESHNGSEESCGTSRNRGYELTREETCGSESWQLLCKQAALSCLVTRGQAACVKEKENEWVTARGCSSSGYTYMIFCLLQHLPEEGVRSV